MANNIYDIAKQGFLTGVNIDGTETQINWGGATQSDDFRVALVGAGYTPDLVNHINMEAVAPVIATAPLVVSSQDSNGTAYAEPVTFTGLPDDGTVVEALVVYRENNEGETPVDSENILITYIEDAENLPLILNGGDVTIEWDLGQDKVFKL